MGQKANCDPLPFEWVVGEEFQSIDKPLPPAPDAKSLYSSIHGLPPEQAPKALCLSGGGIRSATFGLGVMQGLARRGLLREFDYLSTVSGGGYIGGWLTAWIHNHHLGSQGVMEELKGSSSPDPLEPEPRPVQNLRSYSNYLSPKLGFFSADGWTLAATFLRNLILNWMVLVPMLLAVLLLPWIGVAVLRSSRAAGSDQWSWPVALSTLAGGFVLGLYSLSRLPQYLPGLKKSGAWGLWSENQYLRTHLLPLVASAAFMTTSFYYLSRAIPAVFPTRSDFLWNLFYYLLVPGDGLLAFTVLGATLHTGGWWIGVRRARQSLSPYIWLALVAGGALGGLIVWWPTTRWAATLAANPGLYVTLATPLLLGLLLLAGVVFVGLASWHEEIKDPDREWWARSGGWMLLVIVVWLVFTSAVLFGPVLLLEIRSAALRWTIAAGGTLSGVVSALIGWVSRTSAQNNQHRSKLLEAATQGAEKLLAPFFCLTLLVLGSLAVSRVVWGPLSGSLDHLQAVGISSWWRLTLASVLLAFLGYGAGWIFSVNRFSLHAMYRNRLIRAYLGASRPGRKPDPFTGFDVRDNLLMAELPRNERPLHLVNVALNVTGGKELAWQQRKALSFTISRLHAGSWRLGYQQAADYTDEGGISFGTAVTISGAAASPNMGYHSSKALTFLMALFNLRLGAWLPNPKKSDPNLLRKGGPDSPFVLLRETFGQTDEDYDWIYLSDGGHFENLALYEVVRRRAKWIVISDASADPNYTLEDLANAVEKIGVDQGVPIEVAAPRPPAFQPKTKGFSKRCALLRIRYSAVDGVPEDRDGWILYIKPAISGREDLHVKKYSDNHPEFPQQSTADQYFDESQFESYRRLGEQSVEEIAEGWQGPGGLPDFFQHVWGVYLRSGVPEGPFQTSP